MAQLAPCELPVDLPGLSYTGKFGQSAPPSSALQLHTHTHPLFLAALPGRVCLACAYAAS